MFYASFFCLNSIFVLAAMLMLDFASQSNAHDTDIAAAKRLEYSSQNICILS